MESAYFIIALITAGIALAMGLISLFIGLHKDGEKVDIIFGIMCISIFIHFVLPPVGFILIDKAPYPSSIILKRFFNSLYLCLLPWFIMSYTGYKKMIVPLLINGLCLIGYTIMAFTVENTPKPIWVTVALVIIVMAIGYGFTAVRYQLKFGVKNDGYWGLFAMVMLVIFFLLTAINQFWNNYLGVPLHTKIFYPFNLYPLAFILIMGVRLRAKTFEMYRLEKLLRLRDTRWHSLLESMQLIILELDANGKVKYINPFGVQILGYTSANEILAKDWFSNYLPVIFRDNIDRVKQVVPPYFTSPGCCTLFLGAGIR